jgi:hypothetical protein
MVKVPGTIRTIHLEEDAWQQSRVIGKNPDKGVVYQYLGHRDIGNRRDKKSMHCETPNPETPTRGLTTVMR